MSERPRGGGRRRLNRFSAETPAETTLIQYYRAYEGRDLWRNPNSVSPLTSEEVFRNNAPLVLDMGSGKGELVIDLAKHDPDTNYVGIESHLKSIYCAVYDVQNRRLPNVRFIKADVRLVSRAIPDESVSEVHFMFPPPVTKLKHANKDLITQNIVDELHRILEPNGLLHLATDHEPYFNSKRALITGSEKFEEVVYQSGIEGGKTWYQKIWEGHGLPTHRAKFSKKRAE